MGEERISEERRLTPASPAIRFGPRPRTTSSWRRRVLQESAEWQTTKRRDVRPGRARVVAYSRRVKAPAKVFGNHTDLVPNTYKYIYIYT